MGERTFEEWVNWFELKSGEKFNTPPGFSLEFRPDKGFVLWKRKGDTFVINQGTTDDWEFWAVWIISKGLELGCTKVRTLVRRNAAGYARLTGGKIVKKGFDQKGRKLVAIEWDKLPEVLTQSISDCKVMEKLRDIGAVR
ncbi:MAG TPA: hypothetical protein PKA28_19110 [Methylomusa anaerophila]|uniref:Uncharacterized protein n=1 Tax=Methylomusa anaerophila TaxID=1930071 RepID=A0A348AIA1_9FIRM|nr:hypothetical protein [Methylomusa anaerophila]BBB90799.1 hypothetical protein MAMMFC1_01460 [Methylomusa anaerophila]HML90544.1 hypothetical protein [Methylomusa anaerophila]